MERRDPLYTHTHQATQNRMWMKLGLLKSGNPSSQSLSVGHRTGRPVADQFDSLISNVRESPRHGSENEQIRILVERQREQILVDCQAEIRKQEFQADYDRRSL